MLLLEAFLHAQGPWQKLSGQARLIFVGDGPELQRLRSVALSRGADNAVEFKGHLSAAAELAELYGEAAVSVSPGYVGLSIIQSLSFGVPMLVAEDEPHAPELEALDLPAAGRTFPSNDAESLARALVSELRQPISAATSAKLIDEVAKEYSVDAMVDAFLEAVGL